MENFSAGPFGVSPPHQPATSSSSEPVSSEGITIYNDLPEEIRQIITEMIGGDTYRTEVSKDILDRVVTIYKNNKFNELQDAAKELIKVLERVIKSKPKEISPAVSQAIKEIEEKILKVKVNPFISLKDREQVQEKFYEEFHSILKNLTSEDLRAIEVNEGFFGGRPWLFYPNQHVLKVIAAEMLNQPDLGTEEKLMYTIVLEDMKKLIPLFREFPGTAFFVIDQLFSTPYSLHNRNHGMSESQGFEIVKSHKNFIIQCLKYLNEEGFNWIFIIALERSGDNPSAISWEFIQKNINSFPRADLMKNPLIKEIYTLCQNRHYDEAIKLAEQQKPENYDVARRELAIALLLNGSVDKARPIIDSLPQSEEKKALENLVKLLFP